MSMHEKMPRQAHSAIDADDASTNQTRDRVAARAKTLDREYPRALDLEACLVDALHEELHGVASAVCGEHAEQNFRAMLRGERTVPTTLLARLATSPRPESRAAVLRWLRVLAGALNHTVEPMDATTVSAREAFASLAEAQGALSSDAFMALDDNKLDASEVEQMEPKVEWLEAQLAQVKGVMAKAKEASWSRQPGAASVTAVVRDLPSRIEPRRGGQS